MRIEKLTVKNFRSFDNEGIEVVLPDIKKPISIVGHNNSGKSNLINAILFGLHHKSTFGDAFDRNDFYNCSRDCEFRIDVQISPRIKCPNAFNTFNEISSFQLRVKDDEGLITTSHNCYGVDGKVVRSSPAVPLGKNRSELSPEEEEILNRRNRSASETAYKNKDKVPLFYINTLESHAQLRASRFTLLGKMLAEIRKEFEQKGTTVPKRSDIAEKHWGRSNYDVLNDVLRYVEEKIIPTPRLEKLTNQIRDSLKEELDIDGDHFQIGFGIPSFESFYHDLEFYIKENPNKPKLPISRFGNGFISLFVISMLKALIGTDSGGKIIIIEEPETFLHEHYQEYFFKMLERLAEKNQVIYTTHSKKFVNIFEPQTIVKVETPNFGCSKVIHHPTAEISVPEEIDGFRIQSVEDFSLYMRTLEPNIGNVIFARKVIIVEGPHDVLAYKTALSAEYNLEFNNTSIVAAWGKDTLKSLIQICKLFNIRYFVIHDFDLTHDCDASIPADDLTSVYLTLTANEKAQYTKNYLILKEAGKDMVHQNKPDLEGVLGIQNKGSSAVYDKVHGKNLDQIAKEFPTFMPSRIIEFVKS